MLTLFVGLDDSGQHNYSLQFNLIDAEDRFGRRMTRPGSLFVITSSDDNEGI